MCSIVTLFGEKFVENRRRCENSGQRKKGECVKDRKTGNKGVGILQAIVTVALCILINLAGRYFTNIYQLPFWLDTVGTWVAGHFVGMGATILVSAAPIFVFGLANQTIYEYLVVAIILALLARIFGRKGYLAKLGSAMMCSFASGLIAIAVSTPLNLLLRSGYSGNIWGDALFDMMQFRGFPAAMCAVAAEAIVNIVDKQISFFLSFLIIRFIMLMADKSSKKHGAKKLLAFFLAFSMTGMTALFAMTPAAYAQSGMEDPVGRMKTIYSSDNGLNATGLNSVAQTPDGYIWVGGYGGLYRYDGISFEKMSKSGVINLTDLMVDQSGRLWAATTDRGVVLYDRQVEIQVEKPQGLLNHSVRTLYEAQDGTVYVGTSGQVCTVDKNLKAKVLKNELHNVIQFAQNDFGLIGCVSENGLASFMSNGKVIAQRLPKNGETYTCIIGDEDGFWLGTSTNKLHRIIFESTQLVVQKEIELENLNNISCLKRGISGLLWVGAYNGVGTLNQKDEIKVQRHDDFRNAIEDITQDYEGNMWIVSSRYGLMKLSESPFTDVYAFKNLKKKTVNAVLQRDQILYSATDEGLDIVNLDTGRSIQNKLTRAVEDKRVRCIRYDRADTLWACTYGDGIFSYDAKGELRHYTKEGCAAAGDFERCMEQLPDGTIAVGGSEGITFLKNNGVKGVLQKQDGLSNTQILCLTASGDTLYAGTDGAGIYVIQGGEIVNRITEEDGLSSGIVIRITPYKNGFFVVTSNALNYMEQGEAVLLEKFPCHQNYDVLISDDDAWILSSCGIYKMNADALIETADQPRDYVLYDASNGLQGSVTALSWAWIDEKQDLLFCTNEGVQKINSKHEKGYQGPYKMEIASFKADGAEIPLVKGEYVLDSQVAQIEVKAAVLSYAMENLKVRFYLEGLDENPEIINHVELQPLSYKNIPHGDYKLQLELLDYEGRTLQTISVPVIKQAQMWEETYYEIYLVIVIAWMTAYATWVVITLNQISKRKKQLEIMSRQLEEKVAEQTTEIREQSRKITAMQWNLIEGMASLIESRDGTTGMHILNTGNYVRMIANQMLQDGMYPEEIDKRYVQTVSEVALLHDVGKIKVSDLILNKPGPLTPQEYEIMKNHAKEGGAVIHDILGEEADPYLRKMAEDIATYHHERWDGKGYPYGLKGTEIPLCARIMAVADVFDALASKRSYKAAMTLEQVYSAIEEGSNSQFQKEIVEEFKKVKPQVEDYLRQRKLL